MKNMNVDKRIRSLLQPQKYIVVDNFFDDPTTIYNLFYSTKFYNKEKKIIPNVELLTKDESLPLGNWRGLRSPNLLGSEFGKLLQTKVQEVFKKLGIEKKIITFDCFLHVTTENIIVGKHDWHTDSYRYAGVIYMSKNAPKNSGTILHLNNSELSIENVYNRFTLYDASIMHKPAMCFGDSLETSRKTVTFFVNI